MREDFQLLRCPGEHSATTATPAATPAPATAPVSPEATTDDTAAVDWVTDGGLRIEGCEPARIAATVNDVVVSYSL